VSHLLKSETVRQTNRDPTPMHLLGSEPHHPTCAKSDLPLLPIGNNGPFVPDVMDNRFPEFLETEVFPAITAKYRVLQGRDNTAIQGASYSGIAALYALVHRPDLFGSGIVQSPSLQVGNGQSCAIQCGWSQGRRESRWTRVQVTTYP
jgi:hypothetical protein